MDEASRIRFQQVPAMMPALLLARPTPGTCRLTNSDRIKVERTPSLPRIPQRMQVGQSVKLTTRGHKARGHVDTLELRMCTHMGAPTIPAATIDSDAAEENTRSSAMMLLRTACTCESCGVSTCTSSTFTESSNAPNSPTTNYCSPSPSPVALAELERQRGGARSRSDVGSEPVRRCVSREWYSNPLRTSAAYEAPGVSRLALRSDFGRHARRMVFT